MEKVLIRPNPTREKTLYVTPTIVSAIRSFGFQVFISDEFEERLGPALSGKAAFYREEQALELCDFAVVIGGDGTILRMAEAAAIHHKPVLGINVGTIGFMSELEIQELWEMEKIRRGAYELDSRMMITVCVVDEQGNTVLKLRA